MSNRKTNIRLPTAPPAGFKPLSASNADLLKHGLPPRPNSKSCPQLYAVWHRILSQPLTFVPARPVPLQPNELVGRIPIHAQAVTKSSKEKIHTNQIWSGAVNNTLPSGYKFTYVTGSWAVPQAYPQNWAWNGSTWSTSAEKDSNEFKSGTWVGIDGYTSHDVLQAGTAQRCTVNSDGSLKHVTYPWFEWYPDPPKRLEGFDVRPGESVTVQVAPVHVLPNEPTIEGLVFFYNESNCTYTSVFVDIPDDTTFVGDSVEWIIEGHKPKHAGYPTMSYLGTTFIDDCIAIAEGQSLRDWEEKNLKDALLLEIVQNGTVLSRGQKENNKLLGIYSRERTNLKEIVQSSDSE